MIDAPYVCEAPRAAGAAPARSGDPRYSSKLGDGDGVGCE